MQLKIDTNPKVDTLEFHTKTKRYVQSSSPRSITKQRGLEFDHFRAYQPDDDALLIDWKASARANDTLVRVYSEDISLNILIMLDVSETMIYGTEEKAKIEFAIELALNIASGSLNYGDRVGIMMFNESLAGSVPFESGPAHISAIMETLQNTDNFGGKVDLEYALGAMNQLFRDTHLLIFISDFIGYSDFYNKFHAIIDNTDIIGIMVNDKSDYQLDAGGFYMHLSDPVDNDDGFIKGNNQYYKQANIERISELQNFFTVTENDLWTFFTHDPIEKIMRLVDERNAIK